jgi:hypothetical protein
MSKSEKLKKLYGKIELDSSEERILLSKVKNGNATEEELNELIDLVKKYPNGAKTLVDIKNFEEGLVKKINKKLDLLEDLENDYYDAAHLEVEYEKDEKMADIGKLYRKYVAEAEELIEATRIAYFQIIDFHKFENKLYEVKEALSHFEE